MQKRLKTLFLTSNNIERDSYVWNTTQSILFAMQSAIMLMAITRVTSIDDAGVFSIAYAVASLIYYIGEFGVRKFQITDVLEKATFSDYHTHRLVTCFIAAVCSVSYALRGFVSGQYDSYKFQIVLIICFIKVLESYCDVYFARFQQKKRLDVAAKASTYRIVLPLICCIASLIISKNLMIASIIWLIATVIAISSSFVLLAPEFGDIKFHINIDRIRMITIECLPLFAGSFLLLYVGNAPKYAIDACLSDKDQACFNFIFMPVFTIGMLANFIFNPIIVNLAENWNKKEMRAFYRIISRQIGVISAITLLAIMVALTIGCSVLGVIFNTDLSGNRINLAVLMVGGGMLALANFFIVLVTVVRGQKYLIVGYLVAFICALTLSNRLVKQYGLSGAAGLYTGLMTLTSAIFAITFIMCTHRTNLDIPRDFKKEK